jgi:hypothetical protein
MSTVEVSPETRQAIIDEEQLRLLALAHYIDGVLCILFASMFIFHLAFFVVIGTHPEMFPPARNGHAAPPEGMFAAMGVLLGAFILLGWAFGALLY